MNDDHHVYPVGDLKPHDYSRECWCKPRIIESKYDDVVIHNSMDGREQYETGERKPH